MLSHGHGELELLLAVLTPVIVDRHSVVLSLRAELQVNSSKLEN
jgi:hypothetical protein